MASIILKSLLPILLLGFLGGCVNSVKVAGSVPSAIIKKVPVNMGVYYSDEFKSYTHSEKVESVGNWKIDLGEQNFSFFQQLFASMFEHTEAVSWPPFDSPAMESLDGVLVPKITEYGFLSPSFYGSFHEVSIKYEISLYDKEGNLIWVWHDIVGYGRKTAGAFASSEAINEATIIAIRDAGTKIALDFVNQKEVQSWLKNVETESNH